MTSTGQPPDPDDLPIDPTEHVETTPGQPTPAELVLTRGEPADDADDTNDDAGEVDPGAR